MKAIFAMLTVFFGVVLSACQGKATSGAGGDRTSEGAFIDAEITYVGPSSEWAGPASFRVHLAAQPGKALSVSVRPKYMHRTFAQLKPRGRVVASRVDATAWVRTQLSLLAAKMEVSPAETKECLYPVQVRLSGFDGKVIEKSGCRGKQPWVRMVNDLVSESLEWVKKGKKS